ncbi:alkaline phosphatase D family protein [Marinicella sp. S1101]|uniref:alkaline phosphatase D family protein n=1 Tax=Marinicella marina TaxID=2996016 RepID=UPI002260CA4E|nr:alkaline phosphatase D family protein [Marinicella marina]MCX7552843.1 alkaline phosphatase D family protein [Marinicella marina]MDJ1139848.1 alkaline phosphatase D family protein [Marinicella marina]
MRTTLLITLIFISQISTAKQLTAGPMLGHVAIRGANIWAQSPESGELAITYWQQGQPKQKSSFSAKVNEALGNIHTFKLTNLEPGTTYKYSFEINGKKIKRKEPFEFTTQVLWQWRFDPPDFSVMAGSCNFINEAAYDRPGRPYGSGHEAMFSQIASEDADAMLWIGDNWYYREVDFDAEQNLLHRIMRDRSQSFLQPIYQKFANYATWDDHDFGPNNSGAEFIYKEKALEIFKNYWANPSYGMPEQEGVFTRVSYNDIEFFMLDNRYNKSHENAPDGPDKVYYGQAQLNWLKDSLLSSYAPFKIIVGGGQMLNDHHAYEGWDKYRHERDPFIEWLDEAKITGVMFLSGDKHHSEMLRADRPGAYPLYEMTCSPLTAGTHSSKSGGDFDNPRLVKGSLVNKHNYCKFSFSGPRTDRSLRIEVIGSEGQQYWTKQIKSSVLSYSQVPE